MNSSPEGSPKNSNGILDKSREIIGGIVNQSKLPTKEKLGFESTVGIYGGSLVYDHENKLVWDTRSKVSQLDQKGDIFLRKTDEHIAKNPLQILKRHPRWFLKILSAESKRYRGTKEEVAANAVRLRLSDYYGLHPWGIEIKKKEVYEAGYALQDLYRADQINADALNGVDRFQALSDASKYIRQIHDQYGAIGEIVSSDIIFQQREGDKVIKPVLNIPDIVYNPNLRTGLKEQKATDLLDFLNQIGAEEWRRSAGDPAMLKKALETIFSNYGDQEIIKAVVSLADRGRLVLPEKREDLNLPLTISSRLRGIFMQHNKQRLSSQPEYANVLRQEIIKMGNLTIGVLEK